ncbi:NlpC/P60 family protein [Microbacterium sp. zg.Y625]|uniref:NlpC/P60 family protein n=1 Tax=Microbacterium jiangjiandongii TaxID=3049071 RepID=UPI00214A9BF1|nr:MULTISPECIES: NlpC/P60 family protein [unclassified Microbacterium]MCR2793223.1 NlpC/P60 family protein [Microbacterium sp. zg.Y625]WIM25398.1 NlpC/P60 family protein [Microbacterium sp. zg-Y625]
MSVVTALARIDEIEQRIRSLSVEPAIPAATGATTAGATASAGAFASAVEQVRSTLALGDGTVTGEDIVAQAEKYLGVPYVFGGEDATGMDCSGLVQRVLADLGIDAPRVVQDQSGIGVEVPSLAEARPGDLLVTNGEKHIVIYAGDGKIIHAPSPGKNVELRNNYLTDADIQTIRRVVPEAQAAPAATAVAPAALFASALFGTASAPASAPAFAAASTPAFTGASATAFAGPTAAASSAGALRSVPVAGTSAAASAGAAGAGTDSTAAAASGVTAPGTADQVAAPPSPAAAASPARTPLAQQITAPVLSLARADDGQHTLTLRVSPETLGPVTVTAQISGSSLTIELASPSDMGREALRALLVDLRRDLAALAPNASILLAAADTAAGGGPQSQTGAWSGGSASGSASSGQQDARPETAPHGSRQPAADAPPAAPPPPVPGSGIDLFA